MEAAVRHQLRRAIRQVQRRGDSKRQRYGSVLRRAVVEYAQAAQSAGASIASVARALGLSSPTLYGWVQGAPRAFRAVATKPASFVGAPSELRLVTAQGHRVEGLSRDDLVVLLRALS